MSSEAARVALRQAPLVVEDVVALVARPGAGAVDVFLGVVRDASDGRAVTSLEYSAYAPMAVKEMASIVAALERATPDVRLAVHHRTGELRVGELAVVCAASAPHRAEAFAACRALIDELKARVPIWKRERGPDGDAWVGWVDARCAPDHAHDVVTHPPRAG